MNSADVIVVGVNIQVDGNGNPLVPDAAADAVAGSLLGGAPVADRVVVRGPRNAASLAHAVVGEAGVVLERLDAGHAPDVGEGAVHRRVPAPVLRAEEVLQVGGGGLDLGGARVVRVVDLELARTEAEHHRRLPASDQRADRGGGS